MNRNNFETMQIVLAIAKSAGVPRSAIAIRNADTSGSRFRVDITSQWEIIPQLVVMVYTDDFGGIGIYGNKGAASQMKLDSTVPINLVHLKKILKRSLRPYLEAIGYKLPLKLTKPKCS